MLTGGVPSANVFDKQFTMALVNRWAIFMGPTLNDVSDSGFKLTDKKKPGSHVLAILKYYRYLDNTWLPWVCAVSALVFTESAPLG